MPSHFSSIGIPVESSEDILRIVEKAAVDAISIPAYQGSHLRWSSAQMERGPELWIQLNKERQLVGVTPFFEGKSSFTVAVTSEIHRSDDTELEVALHGWANPADGTPETGEYPFVFELVGHGTSGPFTYPFTSSIKLCAFAHELTVYGSEAEYEALNTTGPRFATESFIPSGLFSPGGEETNLPQPYAIFTGRVIESAELRNPLTDIQFQWALIRTLGGTIDVVCDRSLITKPVVGGGVLSGTFWLCGRIVEPPPIKRGFFKRLFNAQA